MDAFTVLAEPSRRQILHHLRRRERTVSELVKALSMAQPTVSKHLKVLRESGFVSVRMNAQQRIYRIEPEPFQAIEKWLAPYRQLWAEHLDALERHLDEVE